MKVDRLQLNVPLLAVVLILSAVSQAAAEPVTLNSGGIFYSRQNQADFNATSLSGISIRGQFGDEGSESWDPDHACFGCTPGTRIDLSQSESFANDSPEVGAGGSIRLNDVDYWFDSLSFQIDGPHIDIPDTSNFGAATVNAGRFVFHGMVTGTSDAGITRTFSLNGKGNVSVFFGNNDWFSTNYAFTDAAAVPEPGTMLLFGSGAVAALVRRRRNPQQHL